jgi:hypothetical protein
MVVNKSFFAGFVALTLVSTITCADAQQLGTPEEARAMLDRAISALKTNEDKALTEFNDPDNKQFHDHDLYVVCFNMSDGKITAYLGPALLGVDIRTLSLNDDPIGQEHTTRFMRRRKVTSRQWIIVFRNRGRPNESRSNSLRRSLAIRPAALPTLNRTKCGVGQTSALPLKSGH